MTEQQKKVFVLVMYIVDVVASITKLVLAKKFFYGLLCSVSTLLQLKK